MSKVILRQTQIVPSSKEGLEKINNLEAVLKKETQLDITTWHTLHGGIYTRTVFIPKGAVAVGTIIEVPTTVTIHGKAKFSQGDSVFIVDGFKVVPGSKDRKQAVVAFEDTYVAMSFTTKQTTIEGAEKEMTSSYEQLMSRNIDAINYITITGE